MRSAIAPSQQSWPIADLKAFLVRVSFCGIALLASGCTSIGHSPDPFEGHPLNGPIPSLKYYYDEALTQARTWHDDALPFWAEVDITNGRTEVFYRFKSGSFPQERYLVQFEITPEGTEMSIFEGSFEGPGPVDPVISLEPSILDSPDVVDLALSHGAREFIIKYPNARDLLIQFTGTSGSAAEELGIEPMRLSWRVGLSNLPLSSINLYFDPYTGEFLGSILRE